MSSNSNSNSKPAKRLPTLDELALILLGFANDLNIRPDVRADVRATATATERK